MARKRSDAADVLKQSSARAYKPCEWVADGEQCRYPASIDDRWCTEHCRCTDAHWGALVVEGSRDYQHPSMDERAAFAMERLNAEAKEYLVEQALQKRANELSVDYIARLRAHNRERFGLVVKKQRAA